MHKSASIVSQWNSVEIAMFVFFFHLTATNTDSDVAGSVEWPYGVGRWHGTDCGGSR